MNPTSLLSGLGAAISAEPTLGAVSSGTRESASGTADLFMALVAGLLDGQGEEAPAGTEDAVAAEGAAGTCSPLAGAPVAAEQPAETDTADPQPDATDVSAVPITLPIIVQPALLAQAVTASSAPTATTGPVGTTAPTAAAVPPNGAGAPTTVDAGAEGQADVGQDTGGDAGTPTGTPAPAPATAQAAPTSVPTAVDPTAGPTPITGAAPAAPTAPVAAPAAPATHRVTGQVFPEVVRVSASTADGAPSRVTLKLNPESLGEVRIVLTSRRGGLEVSLAAGQDARRALVEGAPELHRLLESVGRADSRIVFRDLPGTTPVPSTTQDGSPRTDVSTDLGSNAWSGAGRPGGGSAADRDGARHQSGSTTATDGTASATPESRPVTTPGRSHSGVDLTM